MNPLETEVVGHVPYDPEDLTAFQVSDDLLSASLGGNAGVGLQARLMLQRGLDQF